jgi:hypothetical protein
MFDGFGNLFFSLPDILVIPGKISFLYSVLYLFKAKSNAEDILFIYLSYLYIINIFIYNKS